MMGFWVSVIVIGPLALFVDFDAMIMNRSVCRDGGDVLEVRAIGVVIGRD